jgi:hypothetical protein
MFEREPNIDIVFRNGLKDLEVLPPADVWDNITPMPARFSRYTIIYRIAAGFAVLVSLSLLATWYFRSNNSSPDQLALVAGDQAAQVMNIRQASPVVFQKGKPALTVNDKSTLPAPAPLLAIAAPVSNLPAEPASYDVELSAANNDKSLPLLKDDDITIIVAQNLSAKDDHAYATIKPVNNESSEHRFLIGASVSPAYGFSASTQDAHLADLVSSEKTRPSYTTGLTFGYKISNRLTINSGIGLSSIGQTISGINVFAGLSNYYSVKSDYLYSVETSAGPIRAGNTDLYLTDSRNRVGSLIPGNMADPSKYDLTLVGSDIHQVFRYLELPVLLRYKIIDRRVGLNLAGGMAYGFLVDNFAYTRYGSEIIPVGHTEGVNLHSFSSQLGLGMEYNISPNMSFNFEPVLKYYVTPVSDLGGSLYKPYAFGFYSGFFFKF